VSRVWSTQWFRFQWPWVTLNLDFKVTEMPSTNCVRSWRAICLRQLSSCSTCSKAVCVTPQTVDKSTPSTRIEKSSAYPCAKYVAEFNAGRRLSATRIQMRAESTSTLWEPLPQSYFYSSVARSSSNYSCWQHQDWRTDRQTNGRTDGQTDGQTVLLYQYRANSVLTRDKKAISVVKCYNATT